MCGAVFGNVEDDLRHSLEEIRDDMYVCQSKKARRRFLARVRPVLLRLEGMLRHTYTISPEAEAVLAEIHLCVDVM